MKFSSLNKIWLRKIFRIYERIFGQCSDFCVDFCLTLQTTAPWEQMFLPIVWQFLVKKNTNRGGKSYNILWYEIVAAQFTGLTPQHVCKNRASRRPDGFILNGFTVNGFILPSPCLRSWGHRPKGSLRPEGNGIHRERARLGLASGQTHCGTSSYVYLPEFTISALKNYFSLKKRLDKFAQRFILRQWRWLWS